MSSFCPYPGQDIVGFNISCGLPAAQGGCARGRSVNRSQLLALAAACTSSPGCLAFTSDGWCATRTHLHLLYAGLPGTFFSCPGVSGR